jgi:hypothetical protein
MPPGKILRFPTKAAVAVGKTEDFHNLIDWDALLNKVTQGIDFDPEFAKGFRRGVQAGKNGSLEQRICKAVADGGEYKFLHVHLNDACYGPLFRFREDGTNYHLFSLGKSPDGKIRAKDIYVFASGENMSQTLRRVFVSAAAKPGFLDRLKGKENLFARNVDSISKMNTAFSEGRPAEALQIWKTLPAEVQKEKFVMLLRIYFSQPVDDQEYVAAMSSYREAYPLDGASELLSIDYFLLKKEYQKSRDSIDRLKKLVGGDPHLDVIKAGVFLAEKNFDQAAATIEAVIEADPKMLDAYWTRVTVATEAKDNAATLQWLQRLDANFTMQWTDLSSNPQYADFVKSDEYQEWLKLHPQPTDDADATDPDE